MSENTENKASDKLSYIETLPSYVQESMITVAGIGLFSFRFFKELFTPPFEYKEFLRQAYRVGYQSLLLVSISGFIIGLVMTLQTKPTMREFGAEAWIPSMVSISIIKEIGPVLTALICAGKVGSGIGAELGSMKVTEQIDAMTVSGANPFNFIVVTRILATTLAVPLLVFYADAVALIGSYLGMNLGNKVSLELFLNQALSPVGYADVLPATVKSFFFGFAIGVVGCYKGYNSKGGTVGVGNAANSAVVVASLLIFIIDLIAVQLKQILL